MRSATKVVAALLIAAAIAWGVGVLFGPGAAGTAFLVMAIFLGGYFGFGWGAREATKTEEYRQNLISKRRYSKDSDPAPNSDPQDKSDPDSQS